MRETSITLWWFGDETWIAPEFRVTLVRMNRSIFLHHTNVRILYFTPMIRQKKLQNCNSINPQEGGCCMN